jgi:hypothetical protein
MHLALRCECGAWLKWVRKSQAHRYQREKVPISAPLKTIPVDLSQPPKPIPVRLSEPLKTIPAPIYPEVGESIGPDVVSDIEQPTDLCARVERLERAFAGYDSQLGILVRAILACGVLQGAQSPPLVNVDDNLADRFVREVAEDQ